MPFNVPAIFNTEEKAIETPMDEEPVVDNVTENVIPEYAPQAPVKPPVNDAVTNNSGTVNTPITSTPKEETVTAPDGNKRVDVPYVLSIVWIAGVALMLSYMLISHLILRYKVRGAIVYDSKIRILDKDCSPFILGVFSPVIYIPASANKSDWQYIIAHEKSHLKRLDHVLKPLAFVALCLYWFNPLIWVAYLLLSKDIEYACDERTVKDMEKGDKKAYSLALLSVSQESNKIFAPLSFGKVNVKERIKRVMKYKASVWAISVTAVICIALFILVACTPPANTNEVVSDDKSSSTESDESTVESNETSDAESSETSVEEFKLSIGYATEQEKATVTPTCTYNSAHDRGDDALIKIEASKTVTNFKLVTIEHSDDPNIPHAEFVVFELDELTPESPFYLKTSLKHWHTPFGVRFNDENGDAVCAEVKYTVKYGEQEEIFTDLHFEIIESEFIGIVIDDEMIIVYEPNSGDGFNSYIEHIIETNVSAENIIRRCIEFGLFPSESKMQSFEIRDRVGYLDMNIACYEFSTPYHDNVGIPAVHKTFLANFDIDSLVITYDEKQITPDPVGPRYVFNNTQDIARITFYAYYGQGTGAEVEEEHMAEITNWLASFTVGERAPDEPVDGDNLIYVEIEWADGTVIKVPTDTVTIAGVEFYTSYDTPPECYWEIVSRSKIQVNE